MRVWIGWLILLPFAGAWWLTIKIVDVCIKKSDALRPLGIIISLLVGGASIYAGYLIGPIVGWVIMGVGGLVAIIGVWRSLVVAKYQVEREWLEGLVGKGQLRKSDQEKWENMWISAKEEAKSMLKQDEIDDYERFSLVRSTLAFHGNDSESYELYGELNKLEWKSTLEEAKGILEQGKIDIHKKEEREKFSRIYLKLHGSRDPEVKELWWRLSELRRRASEEKKLKFGKR